MPSIALSFTFILWQKESRPQALSVLLLKSLRASVASAPTEAVVATTAATIAEAEMVGDSSVVTVEVMTEGTIEEEIAVASGIARSAITTISHSATNATVVRLSAQAVVEIPVAVTAEATEVATGETIVVVTDAIIAEETVEEIAEGIGIALSARTTTSHSVTSATVVRLSAQAVVEIPVAVTAEATEVATGETIVAETDAIIAEETVEGIAAEIGIALSARTTTSHSVTSATAVKQIVRAEVAPVVEVTEAAHATVETAVGTTVVDTVDATREEVTAEVQNPLIHAMVAAEEELPEAAADRADLDSEAQVVAASVATDQAEAAVDVESASPQHSSRLLVSSAYGAKRGDALDRRA
ncbi:hypothetical protein OAJ45_00115 [Candidatus Poseidoniales archaeon]|nr:hypothetical protein [Candidatus Poseidoniales archaeon]